MNDLLFSLTNNLHDDTIRLGGIIMGMNGKAYWYKNGKIIEVSTLHITDVCHNYKIFGLTKEYIQSKYDKYNELWGSEGKAREEIMCELMEKGWIRIRQSVGKEGSKWTIQFDNYKKRKKDLQEIVAQLLLDNDEMKDYDTLVLLQSEGDFCKIYDSWRTNTKPSDFLTENKKKAKVIHSYEEFE